MTEKLLASVEIYCQEPSHADRRYVVFRFDQVLAEGRRMWVNGDVRRLAGGKYVMGRLDGSSFLTGDERRRYADLRLRSEFECGLCGLKGVYKYENLVPVLDRLAVVGKQDISLRGLAARLRS